MIDPQADNRSTAAPPDATAGRLLAAALKLIGEEGYHGATTRAIAAEAGVSEVTLFRRFGTKIELTTAALTSVTDEFRAVGAEPTEDVHADLVRLGEAYRRFVDGRPGLVARLLAEVTVGSEIGNIVADLIAGNAAAASSLIVHHQRAGRLRSGPAYSLLSAFLGPILLAATVGPVIGAESAGTDLTSAPTGDHDDVDTTALLGVADHTTRFLHGHQPVDV